MNQLDEHSPYVSQSLLYNEPVDISTIFGVNVFSILVFFIIILISTFVYLAVAKKSETFLNASKRSDPQMDHDYLEMQIDLLNRQQHKNMTM
jgi:hypothetical protein